MILLLLLIFITVSLAYRPLVLMHGLLSSSEAMSHVEAFAKADYPGIHVANIEVGNGYYDSLLMDINEQVALFAAAVQADPKLAGGFNLVGHSQGGLITRAYIERYNSPPVHNYVSLAGPNGGQYGVPEFNADECPDDDCDWLNALFSALLNTNDWYSRYTQTHISFAAYWHDPFAQARFVADNLFLADINNARAAKNATYKANFASLNHVVLVYSLIDNIVIPNASPTFAFFDYVNGSDSVVVPMRQTPDYLGDWIGLQTLDRRGKLETHGVNCTHSDLPRQTCKSIVYDTFVKPWLNN
jgi:palmitoyl-protein thioesterase